MSGPGAGSMIPASLDPVRLAALEGAFAAIGRADVDALVEFYADDYVLELPYAHPEAKRIEGRAVVIEYLRAALAVFRFTLTITRIVPAADPDLWVAEYTSEGHVVPSGAPYANSYVGFVRFRGDRVCALREFYDPLRSAQALSAGT